MIFNCISNMLSGHNFNCAGLPSREVSSFLCPIKDGMEHITTLGVHSIPCTSVLIYTGQCGYYVTNRVEENHQQVHLEQLDKLPVAEHSFKREHNIYLTKKPKPSPPNTITWSIPSDRQLKFRSILTPRGLMA
jgi:hypothetical protein